MGNRLVEQFSAALRVSTPLVGIETPDQGATIGLLCQSANGDRPILRFDLSGGVVGLGEKGKEEADALAQVAGVPDPSQLVNASETLALALRLAPKSILFIYNVPFLFDNPVAVQAIQNCRDQFKANKRCLVLLGGVIKLPQELQNDVILLEEEYPAPEELQEILLSIYQPAREKYDWPELTEKEQENVIDALRGLPAFLAEQITAMSLDKEKGLDLGALWERKKKAIEQTPGLSLDRETVTFDDVAGLENLKDLAMGLFNGRNPPKIIVRIEEIEKAMAGAAKGSLGDSSGVSQDALQTLLNAMEDNDWRGLLAEGVPGSGKSLISKVMGGQFGCLSLAADMGAMKGSLVGESEAKVRNFVKLVKSIAGKGGAFFVATSNDSSFLRPELIERFSFGRWQFEKPDREQRLAIWKIHLDKLNMPFDESTLPNDEGWVGRNIRNCVELAWRLDITPKEASRFVSVGGKSLKASRSLIDGQKRQVDL